LLTADSGESLKDIVNYHDNSLIYT